jgi:DNA-binding beta-propeller fold protein YncE
LTPRGSRVYGGENCWNIVMGTDQKEAALFYENGINLYPDLSHPLEKSSLKRGHYAFTGAFTPGGDRLVVSSGEKGGIESIKVSNPSDSTLIDANVDGAKQSYVNDLALSKDGRYCYGVDVANQDLLTFDLTAGRLVSRTKAGREPYAIVLSDDGTRVFVANIGIFDYSPIPHTDDPRYHANGLSHPPFAFPSKESEEGTDFEGRHIPGIGDPNVPDAHSVFAYDLSDPTKPAKSGQANCGVMVHAPTESGKSVGGSAPCALAYGAGKLYVANSNNDTVQAFDGKTLILLQTIRLTPSPIVQGLRGVIPDGLAVDPQAHRLYVAEAGLDAIGVADTDSGKLLGQIPTGYFPSSVRIAGDGRIAVSCLFGLGQGPQGAKTPRLATDERFGLPGIPGMASLIDLPSSQDELTQLTQTVLENNGIVSQPAMTDNRVIPNRVGQLSKDIQYVVYITKENHTYDGIFGTLGNANGEPSYSEWGENGWIREKGNAERVRVMPNHLKLARQFAISDNFYLEPGASGAGHRWLIGVYASLWTTKLYYSGWEWSADPATRGRMISFGSNGSQIPEDYEENGSMWEHLASHGITFRNYGEGFEFPGVDEGSDTTKTGGIEPLNIPINKVLWSNTCWDFPIFNTNIPDVARFEWFRSDLENNYRKKGKPIPHFMNITYCNDHGTEPRPDDGYPYVCSYMADNDLALGKTIEYLSSLPEWKHMAVFVTQDDCGGDDDHVDRMRSYVLALGPWVKKGYVSHVHTSFMSVQKTIYEIFGCGPNNMFDALVSDLSDMFTDQPDSGAYASVDSDSRIFVADRAYRVNDPKYLQRRFMRPSMAMDDPRFVEKLRQGNRPHFNDGDDDDK